MLTINERKFAKNDKEFINSLFEGKTTCDGYYKKKGSQRYELVDGERKTQFEEVQEGFPLNDSGDVEWGEEFR